MQSLQSVRSEHRFRSLLASIKAKPVHVTLSAIRALAIAHPNVMRRYREAIGYLSRESISGCYTSEDLVDRVLGLDAIFNWRGYLIGVDVTLDPSAVESKEEKLNSLAIAHQSFGIDFTMVVVVDRNLDAARLQGLIREAIASRFA